MNHETLEKMSHNSKPLTDEEAVSVLQQLNMIHGYRNPKAFYNYLSNWQRKADEAEQRKDTIDVYNLKVEIKDLEERLQSKENSIQHYLREMNKQKKEIDGLQEDYDDLFKRHINLKNKK